ncbi:MAG TPA: hypothetical protein VEB21_07690 [Terriglobales bacterium]|nr:hypothetical protein [Terriglobales bacterium]
MLPTKTNRRRSARSRSFRRRSILWIACVSALAALTWRWPNAGLKPVSAGPIAAEPDHAERPSRPAPLLLSEAQVHRGLEQRYAEMESAREVFARELAADLAAGKLNRVPGADALSAIGQGRARAGGARRLPRPGELPPGVPASLAD